MSMIDNMENTPSNGADTAESLGKEENTHHHTSCCAPVIDIELHFDSLQSDSLLRKALVHEYSNSATTTTASDSESDFEGEANFHSNYYLETDSIFTDTESVNGLQYPYFRRQREPQRERRPQRKRYRGYQKLGSITTATTTTTTTTASNSFMDVQMQPRSKRKWWPAGAGAGAIGPLSGATSDISGRFDDADESSEVMLVDQPQPQQLDQSRVAETSDKPEDARSVHSAKRGRSNGWPLQNEIAYDENGMKIDLSVRRSTPTPTPTKAQEQTQLHDSDKKNNSRQRASPVLRARRSRFIEGSMNDRASDKPPSIFFAESSTHSHETAIQQSNAVPDETKKVLEKRSSGIFRFGKAIASAFHPFSTGAGAAGGGTTKNNHHKVDQNVETAKSQKEIMKQRQVKAEKAYAELKKSGYKGTYTRSNNLVASTATANVKKNMVDASVADETWKTIQEKMRYKYPAAEESRISQDDSLVGVSASKDDADEQHRLMSPPPLERGILKLKSLSELRKRTSNLSIPAMRFRESSPMSVRPSIERDESVNTDHRDKSHQSMDRRRSRKDLQKQAKLLKRVSNLEDKLDRARRELLREYGSEIDGAQISTTAKANGLVVPTICVDDHETGPNSLPTLLSERLLEAGYTQDGLSSGQSRQGSQAKSRWPPVDSLSRKRRPHVATSREAMLDQRGAAATGGDDEEEDYDADCGKPVETPSRPRMTTATNPESAKRTRNKLHTAHDKRASSLTTRASQRLLKAKQSSRNLRADAIARDEASKEQDRNLQEQDGNTTSAAIPVSPGEMKKNNKTKTRGWTPVSGVDDVENVPPVPPVPKDLIQSTKSVSPEKIKSRTVLSTMRSRIPSKEFSWPEDIF